MTKATKYKMTAMVSKKAPIRKVNLVGLLPVANDLFQGKQLQPVELGRILRRYLGIRRAIVVLCGNLLTLVGV